MTPTFGTARRTWPKKRRPAAWRHFDVTVLVSGFANSIQIKRRIFSSAAAGGESETISQLIAA